MPRVQFDKISKAFAGRNVLSRIDLLVADGEYLVLLGPSGSGKTTLLRLLAGLEVPDTGRLSVDGRDLQGVDPADRGIALVFQTHALYPQLTARENLALPLQLRRVAKPEINERVAGTAASMGLTPLLDRWPEELSGGERQRIALGRALIARPGILLLDEPLSDLDPLLRTHLRGELRRLALEYALTVIHVTHDQREALSLGDRIAVLHDGVLQQTGAPEEIYCRPANPFMARFIGDPPMNLWRLPDGSWLGVRPEHLAVSSSGCPVFTGAVVRIEYSGREHWLIVRRPDAEVICLAPPTSPLPAVGSTVALYAPEARQRHFAGQNLEGTRAENPKSDG